MRHFVLPFLYAGPVPNPRLRRMNELAGIDPGQRRKLLLGCVRTT